VNVSGSGWVNVSGQAGIHGVIVTVFSSVLAAALSAG